MKVISVIKFLAILCLLCSCSGNVKKENNNSQTNPEPAESKPVKIVFALRTSSPEGPLQPDRVTIDGKICNESAGEWMTGKHTFTIEKQGYETKTVELEVTDEDEDGFFQLSAALVPKKRLVRFNITDLTTKEVIEPEQVMISAQKDSSVTPPELLSDGAFVVPGPKKLVIQKQGYQNFSQDILIEPDEAPFLLTYSMTPIEKKQEK